MGDFSNGQARIPVLEQPADAWTDRCVVEPYAHGPLDGTCFAVKDAFDVEGRPTGFGNPTWRSAHLSPRSTAASVERLLRAGARLIGKTCMDEIAYAIEGRNFHSGAPLNPAAPDRFTGGSSSGAASAVAAGEIDFGLATDTAGSVRVPAAWCGLVGLRPTHGRVSALGLAPLAPSFDTIGWLTRSIPIARVVASVLLEPRPAPPGQSSLVRDPAIDRLLQGSLETLRSAHDRCAAHGLPCEEISVGIDLQRAATVLRILQGSEVWITHGAWIEAERPQFGPAVAERLSIARSLLPAEVHDAEQARAAIIGHLDALLPPGRVLCLPTVPAPAARRTAGPEALEALRIQVMPLTALASLSGRPQLTLPWLAADGRAGRLLVIGLAQRRRGAAAGCRDDFRMMRTARSKNGMVSAPHALAAQSGASILAEGGNAIEAALGVAATLCVVYPHMTGLGGDSFWLTAVPGSAPIAVDGAGRAGAAVNPELYHERGLAAIPWRGPLAANTVGRGRGCVDPGFRDGAALGRSLAALANLRRCHGTRRAGHRCHRELRGRPCTLSQRA